MGILNVTPDSFFDGGKHKTVARALAQVERMLAEGATFIDVGGQSTRPGAVVVPMSEELGRVLPIIKAIVKQFPQAYISIDTFRAEVAKQAVSEGASLVNDISGGELDPAMFETVAALKTAYVLMHTRGTPQTMAGLTNYDDLLLDLMGYFHAKIALLHQLGCHDLVIDPGFGFAKTLEQSHFLLHHLAHFQILHQPLMAGVSRKSMIYRKVGGTAESALNGTTALNAIAIQQKAALLRVHDVREAVEVIKLLT